jgi:broad specificity phosphatase PhoE
MMLQDVRMYVRTMWMYVHALRANQGPEDERASRKHAPHAPPNVTSTRIAYEPTKQATLPPLFLQTDEPTNDLDLNMVEVLEELVRSYGGVLLVVSHDRAFMVGRVGLTTVCF